MLLLSDLAQAAIFGALATGLQAALIAFLTATYQQGFPALQNVLFFSLVLSAIAGSCTVDAFSVHFSGADGRVRAGPMGTYIAFFGALMGVTALTFFSGEPLLMLVLVGPAIYVWRHTRQLMPHKPVRGWEKGMLVLAVAGAANVLATDPDDDETAAFAAQFTEPISDMAMVAFGLTAADSAPPTNALAADGGSFADPRAVVALVAGGTLLLL